MSALLDNTSLIAKAARERLFPEPDPFINDPVAWAEQKLGLSLWSKQKEILESVRDHRKTAVKSCHGPGKSFTASIAGAWWEDVHPIGSSFLITTAPSWAQVQAILWREIRRRHRQGNLSGRITLDCVWHAGESGKAAASDEEIIGMGRKPQDYDEATFQGIHARYFMGILDEACGVDEWLWNAVITLVTNENARILAIGNPDDPNSAFAKYCESDDWNVITISAYDTPNFTGEYVPEDVGESLVSPVWVEEREKDWGIGSPMWVSKVLGEFPDVSDDYLIPPSLIAKAHRTDLPGLERGRYGLDIARMGQDRSVMYRNRGGQIRLVKWWAKKDTAESTDIAQDVLNKHPLRNVPVTADIVGVGAGVADHLRQRGFPVVSFQGSERPKDPRRFKNRRAEVYWHFREDMEAGLVDLDEADEVLSGQLTSIRYGVDGQNKIFIETKEEMRKRGLPSPDHADCAVLSTVDVHMPSDMPQSGIDGTLTSDLLSRAM